MVTTNREKGTSHGYFEKKGLRRTTAAMEGARLMRTKATVRFRPKSWRPFASVAAPMSTIEKTQDAVHEALTQ